MIQKISIVVLAFVLIATISKAQTVAAPFNGVDCNGTMHDLFTDLDAGKAVALHFYMPNCGSCPPPAQAIQEMANTINASHPGMVKGYAFPFQNSTTCAYSSSWVSTNGLSSIYVPMDSGAYQVAYYGGFGMPTVVLLGGLDHRVMFSTQSFAISDTSIMRDSIMALLSTGLNSFENNIASVQLYPNPAQSKTFVDLTVTKSQKVQIELFDVSGKFIRSVYNNVSLAGSLKREIEVSELPNGVYFLKISAEGVSKNFNFNVNH